MENRKQSRYIDIPKFRGEIEKVLREAVESWDEAAGDYVRYMKDTAYDYMPDYVEGIVDDTIKSFDIYLHRDTTRLFGNFADIQLDYEREHEGKSFRKLVKNIDSGIENADAQEFREWTVNWYFNAFGTYNLKYKWTEFMEDIGADCEDNYSI